MQYAVCRRLNWEQSNGQMLNGSLLNLEERNVAFVDKIVWGGMDANQALRVRFSSDSLQLDRDACANLDSTIVPCCGELRELNRGHYHKVDEPSCSTPTKRPFNLPSVESIEELKTPAFEELLNTFWGGKSSKLANGDVKHSIEEAPSLRDSRVPLTAVN
ncbi:hypothetical protein K7X08_032112 [Anisodus acutangulus]|uniref:Uncharacterized protein n=1 Tax=Anisodus acutangulus TaxID=402998 RepID=A0A9Q1RMR1_9SOLA|nr:hypothetical protein K7X08_032112 [Anisodus acutangulus]